MLAAIKSKKQQGEHLDTQRKIEGELAEARAMMEQARKMQRDAAISKIEIDEALSAARKAGAEVNQQAEKEVLLLEGKKKIKVYVWEPDFRPNGEPRNPKSQEYWRR
jgi:hypothetical protein